MATDMQSVNAALVNLDSRIQQMNISVTEATEEAKEFLEAGGVQLQRDLGANIAKHNFDAKTEFERQQKNYDDLTRDAGILFANNTQAITNISDKTEASFDKWTTDLTDLQSACERAYKKLTDHEGDSGDKFGKISDAYEANNKMMKDLADNLDSRMSKIEQIQTNGGGGGGTDHKGASQPCI